MLKNFIITGGSGFIGSHLCEKLLKLGYDVYGIDSMNDYYDINLKMNISIKNAPFLRKMKGNYQNR